ncbi:MAG: hemerythrin domain-containing protein [Thiomonas sp.]
MRIDHLAGSASVAGFEVPLEMLSACHGRVEAQCATLRRLLPHVVTYGADQDAQWAASRVMRYFDTAAKDHHADEEQDLFPALLESMAGSGAVDLHDIITTLTRQHREIETAWRQLRLSLARLENGDPLGLDANEVEAFIQFYERHIACEEEELLPMAKQLLNDEILDRIGRAMRRRRSIDNIDGLALRPGS